VRSDLPEGWEIAPIGELCEVNPKHDTQLAGSMQVSFAPMATVDDINGELGSTDVRSLNEVRSGYSHFMEGDVLFAKITPCMENGKMAVARGLTNGLGCGTTEFIVLRSRGVVLPDFLHRFLRQPFYRQKARAAMTGVVGQARVPRLFVEQTELPMPPLNEQKRIVAKIEELTARTRRAKQALDAVPPLLDKLRQSILAAAFRGDLTADWRAKNPNVEPADQLLARVRAERRSRWDGAYPKKKYVEPELVDTDGLPGLPEGWCYLPLPLLGELARGKSKHRPRNDPALFGASVPFIQTGDVARSGGYIAKYATMYSDIGVRQSRVFPRGTVCITIAANIADTAILGFDACFPDSVVGFQADGGELVASFVEMFIRTIRGDLRRFAPATAQANINLEVLGSVAVPLPPFEELRLIVGRVGHAMKRAAACAQMVEVAREQHKLDASILAKAFRGELVPQDPTDEPASVLLDRIRTVRASAEAPPKSRRAREPKPTSAPVAPAKPPQLALELDSSSLPDEAVAALWPHGPLEKDAAVRKLADHLRELGRVDFQRLHADGPLYAQLLAAIESAVKAGQLDRPRRGYVRAFKLDPTTYSADDWQHVLVASLGPDPIHQEDAIRQAAEWARDNLGLEFARLRSDGHITTGLRAAITRAIRQGLVQRDGPKRIMPVRGLHGST
jgi:type I restriction enzyme S subunit